MWAVDIPNQWSDAFFLRLSSCWLCINWHSLRLNRQRLWSYTLRILEVKSRNYLRAILRTVLPTIKPFCFFRGMHWLMPLCWINDKEVTTAFPREKTFASKVDSIFTLSGCFSESYRGKILPNMYQMYQIVFKRRFRTKTAFWVIKLSSQYCCTRR